jgi:hypothetical protein
VSPLEGVHLEEDFAALVSDRDLKVRDFRRVGLCDKFHCGDYSFSASLCDTWHVLAVRVLFPHADATKIEIVAWHKATHSEEKRRLSPPLEVGRKCASDGALPPYAAERTAQAKTNM